MPVVVFRNAPRSPSLDARAVKRRAESMLASIGESRAELSVMLTDDASIHELNRKHRRKSRPTDVLAFPMDENGEGPSRAVRLLGDVVISLDTAARQARERRRALMDEVVHLLAHGLLHLVGYDHHTDADERRMNAAAEKLIAAADRRDAGKTRLTATLAEIDPKAALSLNKFTLGSGYFQPISLARHEPGRRPRVCPFGTSAGSPRRDRSRIPPNFP